MTLAGGRTLVVALLLGIFSKGCPGRDEQLTSVDGGPAAPLVAVTKRDADELPACAYEQAVQGAVSDQQLLDLIGHCVGRATALELRRLAISDTEMVARAFDNAATFSALAWIEQRASTIRIVALTTASPETGLPYSLRKETLAGEGVIVEGMATRCWESDLHWSKLPVEPDVGLGALVPARSQVADECPRRVERIWRHRGPSLLSIGAYAIEGEQRVNATNPRVFEQSDFRRRSRARRR